MKIPYNEIISELKNMTDEEMIAELEAEGVVVTPKNEVVERTLANIYAVKLILDDDENIFKTEYTYEKQALTEAIRCVELLPLHEEYIELLLAELNETVSIASIHGWRSSRVEQGRAIREKIDKAKGEV